MQGIRRSKEDEVAIVGMACTYPKAPDLDTFWRNILDKVDAVTDPPEGRWNLEAFYDPANADGSKIYAKRGGYLDTHLPFDCVAFGVMPRAVEGGEPDQFLVMKTAADAMKDAGYAGPMEEGARVAFILGRGSYIGVGSMNLIQRTLIVEQTLSIVEQVAPRLSGEEREELQRNLLSSLLPFGPDTATAVMPNLAASRVANRLGFMGPSFTLDAACASSLLSVDIAVRQLQSAQCDLALAGGVHIFNTVPFLTVFCALGAMSRRQEIRPFDQGADGLLPGEGVGIVVLKRRRDAERDGNRIYAIVKGVGSSSDGRGGSLNAPRLEGEVLAMRNAYKMAGISPDTLGLIEAHGTATEVGDALEIQALSEVFGKPEEGEARTCAIGSIKSMIGHAMPAAGVAGLIKAALALYHKVLPPTLHCEAPHPKLRLESTRFYVNTETRPWIHGGGRSPRRAGVNAFGFGGINAHTVLEEYVGGKHAEPNLPWPWDTEVFLFCADSREALIARVRDTLRSIDERPLVHLSEHALPLARDLAGASHRLSVVADSKEDLADKLAHAIGKLSNPSCGKIRDIRGIYFTSSPLGREGKIVFMFPGEGSPYTNMMSDLCLRFPPVRGCFDELDRVIGGRRKQARRLPSQFIFPGTLLSKEEQEELEQAFWGIDSGLQSILAANFAAEKLLERMAVRPDMIIGHSAGEYSAWIAAGILDKNEFFRHQERLARLYTEQERTSETALVAVSTNRSRMEALLKEVGGELYVSNDNCPHQVVVLGTLGCVERLTTLLKARGILYELLPSKQAHHTPLSASHEKPLRDFFSSLAVSPPKTTIYSATLAAEYPEVPEEIVGLMVDYWLKPLEFRSTVEAMYEAGARIFVETGPGANLIAFVDDTLRGKPHIAVAMNHRRKSGLAQLCHLIGILAAHHVPMNLDALFRERGFRYVPGTVPAGAAETPPEAQRKLLPLALPEMKVGPALAARLKEKQQADRAGRQAHGRVAAVEPGPPEVCGHPRTAVPPPPTGGSAPGRHPGREAGSPDVMKRYLENMTGFLQTQGDVMHAYLSGKQAAGKPRQRRGAQERRRPFVGEILSLEPNAFCRVRRDIDLREDIFLRDHPFGGTVSRLDPDLLPLIVVPLTVGLEIMVEAASLLFPGTVPDVVKEVAAHRWIEVEPETPTTLWVDARRVPAGSNEVKVSIEACQSGAEGPSPLRRLPVLEATVVFPGEDPQAVSPEPLQAEAGWGAPRHTAEEVYRLKFMPHGKRFHVLAALDKVSQDGLVSRLRVPEEGDLFASNHTPALLVSPLLLDACAQSLGYWAQENLSEGFITFPVGPQEIRFHAEPPKPQEILESRMKVRKIDEGSVYADFDLIRADGGLWASLRGWRHRRFVLPAELYPFWRFPGKAHLSRAWDTEEGGVRTADPRSGFRASTYPEIDGTIWKKAIAYLYLNQRERRVYRQFAGNTEGGNRWLAARIAAKDAVRALVKTKMGVESCAADIEIEEPGDGTLRVRNDWIRNGMGPVFVSVTHGHECAVAVASNTEGAHT